MELLVILGILVVISVFAHLNSLSKENSLLKRELMNTKNELASAKNALAQSTHESAELTTSVEALRAENSTLRKSLSEAPLGFPSLIEALRLYDFQRDKRLIYWLENKSHPAYTAAEIVKLETRKRRDAELDARRAKLLLEYYFSILPNAHEYLYDNTEQAALLREMLSLNKTGDIAGHIGGMRQQNSRLQEKLTAAQEELTSLKTELTQKARENQELTKAVEALRSENDTLRKSLSEAPLGFPSLLDAIKLYDSKRDENTALYLKTKSHPAHNAAEIVKLETRKRRDAELDARNAKLLLDYYFSIFPDSQEALDAATDQHASSREAPSLDNTEDIAGRYLSREEYDKLSSAQRNQLALDRFWNWNKSKRMISRLYEQYIGWLYEHNGWIVEYFGISEGFSDLGRDLIYHKDNTTLIIQCKNWSKSKRIYEKHIFQLFGTTHEYMKNNPFEEVRAVFFTSTQLSELAHMFAKEFRIELHEGFELKRFPIIKCNFGREGERIYHLPFDQQYYTTRINPADGDFYCSTTAEAEAQGFRRAYRWHGSREDF